MGLVGRLNGIVSNKAPIRACFETRAGDERFWGTVQKWPFIRACFETRADEWSVLQQCLETDHLPRVFRNTRG